MKKFIKSKIGQYICHECSKPLQTICGLSHHISRNHNLQEYYDKYLKENKDDECKICGAKLTKFIRLQEGYGNCCNNIECQKKYNVKRSQEETKKKYGVTNANKIESVRNKIKKTNNIRYGADTPLQGSSKDKITNTCIKKYGVKYPFQSKLVRDKRIKTYNEKYGVNSPLQNKEIFNKAFKTRIKLQKYKNTSLTYQSSYELDFLEKYYQKFPDLINGLSIRYQLNKKEKIYHSDFFIPSLNLIIEIKNKYLYETYNEEIKQKEIYTKKAGYNYILILEKDYSKFENDYKL